MIQPGYRDVLHTAYHQQLFASRTPLSYEEYEAFYQYHYPEDGTSVDIPHYDAGRVRLVKMEGHKRIYQKLEAPQLRVIVGSKETPTQAQVS